MMNLNDKYEGFLFIKEQSFHLQFNNGSSTEQNICKFNTFVSPRQRSAEIEIDVFSFVLSLSPVRLSEDPDAVGH